MVRRAHATPRSPSSARAARGGAEVVGRGREVFEHLFGEHHPEGARLHLDGGALELAVAEVLVGVKANLLPPHEVRRHVDLAEAAGVAVVVVERARARGLDHRDLDAREGLGEPVVRQQLDKHLRSASSTRATRYVLPSCWYTALG